MAVESPLGGLLAAAQTLRRLDVEFALVGGIAVAIRGGASVHRGQGTVADLIAASCGIEREIVERAAPVPIADVGEVLVARAEELLAMKVLSMTDKRPQDRIDAVGLLLVNDDLDLEIVKENLREIARRGFHRDQDLLSKLEIVIDAARDA